MIYLIALIGILIFIVLFLLFYSPKHKSEQELEQHARAVDELTSESPQVLVELESILETEIGPESAETGAEIDVTGEDADLALDERTEESETVVEEHDLELAFDEEVIADDGPELDFAPPEEASGGVVAEEHELELTFDEVPEDADKLTAVPEPELSFEESPEVVTEEPELIELEEVDEEIPFIVEEGEAPPRKSEEDVAPALSGFSEDEAILTHEETPEDLAERLDFFFGSDDEEAVAETAEELGEPEEAVADAVEVPEVEAVPVEVAPEVAVSLTWERYETGLCEQKERLRRDLSEAIESRETAKLSLLELGLVHVCGRLADMQASLSAKQELIADIESTLGSIGDALPGFEGEAVRRNLYDGDGEAAGSLLAEAASQLDATPELAARISYLGGRLAEEQAEFAVAFERYRGACESEGDSAEYLYAAGHMARILGLDEEAQQWLEKLVNAEGQDGDDNVVPVALHELARVHVRTGQKDKAELLMKQALTGMEKLGADYPGLGSVAHDLAALYESSGMYEQAEPLYKRALEVTEKGLGSDHPFLGATLNKLAGLYEEMELEDQAEPLYLRALDIKKKVLGEQHPDVGTILNNLANLLKLRGKYDEAEPMFLQSLDIGEKALGSDHPNLAVVLNNIAELYSETGKEEEAALFQERAFALFELPGGGGDFVEMEKDHEIDIDDEKNQTIAGS